MTNDTGIWLCPRFPHQILWFDGSMDTFDVSITHSDDEIMVNLKYDA